MGFRVCFVFIFFSFFSITFANEVKLTASLAVDESGKKSLQQILQKNTFKKQESTNFNFGFTSNVYWFKLKIDMPQDSTREHFLRVDYALLDRIVLFTPNNNGTFSRREAGDTLPFDRKEIEHSSFHFKLDKNSKTYYLRVQTTSSMSIPLAIVTYDELITEININKIAAGIFYGSFIIMVLYNFFMFLAIRNIKYLYFIIFLLAFMLALASIQGHAFEYLWPTIPKFNNVTDLAVSIAIITIVLFTQNHLQTAVNYPLIHKIYTALSIIGGLFIIGKLIYSYRISMVLNSATGLFLLSTIAVNCVIGILRKHRTTIIYSIAWASMIIGVITTVLLRFGLLPNSICTIYSGHLGGMILVALISLSLADQINTLKESLAELNQGLEEKVKERTQELKETLDQVNKLKEQQDGDYFLTSLLIRPLTGNHTSNKNVSIDIYQEQKKKFSFRGHDHEIGGDICIAHQVELEHRNYTVFVNADAMGKSMQGAGGVLVLGSVFHSIVERTSFVPSERTLSPEKWLKNTFLELHKVFETFDGSMLISLVLGLVDVETGLMYYINAEHPWSVLYRDKKAEFLEKEMDFRKLGTQGMSGFLFIRTFQMQPGDIIIAGSDGRDDIQLESTGEQRLINEDEQAFLQRVEEGEGDLQKITERLLAKGHITDDLSLLRIAFNTNSTSNSLDNEGKNQLEKAEDLFNQKKDTEVVQLLQSKNYQHYQAWGLLARAHFRLKEYQEAIELLEKVILVDPADIETIYLTSYCHKLEGNYERAAQLGERILLRNRGILKNLVNLADVHIQLGNLTRAKKLVDQAQIIDEHNKSVAKVKEKLAKRVK